MTATPPRAPYAGLVLLASVGAVSFAVSFDHVHTLFETNGQDGWVGWALAVVVELLAAGSGLELVRRSRTREPVFLPSVILLLGVAMTLWGNLASADPGPAGHLVAAFPAVATLLILATVETARAAAAERAAVLTRPADPVVTRVPQVHVPPVQPSADPVSVPAADPVAADPDPVQVEGATRPAGPVASAVPTRVRTRATRRSGPVQPPAKVGVPEAVQAALAHRVEHDKLPGQAELARLAGTSESTAKRALKEIRETPPIHLVKTTATG
jgi:hypothetical protein